MNRKLLIGIGNVGRKDDGLGWLMADKVAATFEHLFDVEYRYQLQIEDADKVSQYQEVYFVDASHASLPEGFEWKICSAADAYQFSSHVQTPEAIMYLAQSLFGKQPQAWIIAISGNEWSLDIGLTDQAQQNLERTWKEFESFFGNYKERHHEVKLEEGATSV